MAVSTGRSAKERAYCETQIVLDQSVSELGSAATVVFARPRGAQAERAGACSDRREHIRGTGGSELGHISAARLLDVRDEPPLLEDGDGAG
jgi:hypothetical protein